MLSSYHDCLPAYFLVRLIRHSIGEGGRNRAGRGLDHPPIVPNRGREAGIFLQKNTFKNYVELSRFCFTRYVIQTDGKISEDWEHPI